MVVNAVIQLTNLHKFALLRVLTSFSDSLSFLIRNFAFIKAMNQDDESETLQGYYSFSNIIPLGGCGGPGKDQVLWSSLCFYCLSS